MSEANGNGSGHRQASISSALRRQSFRRGELAECQHRVRVEGEEAVAETLGEVEVLEMIKEDGKPTVYTVAGLPGLFAGSRDVEREDATREELELAPEEARYLRWRLDSAEDLGGGRAALTLTLAAVIESNGSRTTADQPLAAALFQRLLSGSDAIIAPKTRLQVIRRQVSQVTYGWLTVIPQRRLEAQRETERLVALYCKEHGVEDKALLQSVWIELSARGEAGRMVIDFDGFCDDDGPIPSRGPDGALDVEALVRILSIEEFRAPLNEIYLEARMDLEQWGFFQAKSSPSSTGISPTPPPSETSLPS